ncbi:DM13 domain-containing protein [Acidimicrobiaceae bacterium AH-315-P05]|nr:DM13 domain-containing protein [Acidimicrobiaceae bacterium AH-315-P05]
MFTWIRENKIAVGGGGVVALGIVGYLAFAVFGVHTLFIDDVVSEDGPVFSSGATATTAAPSADVLVATSTTDASLGDVAGEADLEDDATDDPSVDESPVDAADDFDEADASPVDEAGADEPTAEVPAAEDPDANASGEVTTIASGSFIGRAHGAEGTVVVLNDGSAQRFLRFEDDFATDNGPDLFVYLSKGTTADGPNGDFDEDFVSLGMLSGNVGSQNYEIPEGLDLSEYNTVSVWCRRFTVAFAAADLVLS